MKNHRARSVLRRSAAVAGSAAALMTGVVMSAGDAQAASQIDCGYSSSYADSIVTDYADDGSFQIHLAPTLVTRYLGAGDPGDSAVTNELWGAIQSCVPGLYGPLADSIYQQLQCHVWGGAAWFATGPTFDLESWHLPLVNPGLPDYVASRCLNQDGGWRVVPEGYGTLA